MWACRQRFEPDDARWLVTALAAGFSRVLHVQSIATAFAAVGINHRAGTGNMALQHSARTGGPPSDY